jgi:catechol-2,3-dioxygenase
MKDTSIIRPVKLAHIVLKTNRYKALVDWYRLVLGAEVTHGDDMATFLTYDDEHHRIAIVNMPSLPQTRAMSGVDHFAFTYSCLADLLATYKRLKGAGIEPVWPINHGATFSLYYRDPDANIVELQVDAFSSLEETQAFLADGRFAINPIGIDIDIEEVLVRHEAGASDEELMRWPEQIAPRTKPPSSAYLGRFHATLFKIVGLVKPR